LTRLGGWWKAACVHQVSVLPHKLDTWARVINAKVLPGTTREQVQALVTNIQALTYRLQDLLEVGAQPQATALMGELHTDVEFWRDEVERAFKNLSVDPMVAQDQAYRGALDGIVNGIETRIRVTLDNAAENTFGTEDGIAACRLLGAYRGISEATVAFATTAARVDWAPWREERF
jgi:hypothetical protein